MTNTFIKRPELIEESYQTEDLLDFSSIIDDFKERINKINNNSVVGLIGPYGSGKSTMLYQIYKDQINVGNHNNSKASKGNNSKNNSTPPKEKWFIFDAWQYPERKDLWEGFVLDIARQCDEKLFKKIENRIDGNTGKNKKALSNAAIDTSALIFPPAKILKNFTYLFQTSPIKRVYDFQDLLLDILNRIDTTGEKVFIVIEDIDRSGDMGIYFLETLKYFIKNCEKDIKHKIIVIVPMGEEIWQEGGDKKIQDSYSKILDLNITFPQEDIDFTNFINQVFDIDILLKSEDLKTNMISSNKNFKNILITSFSDITISHLRYLFENMILKEQQKTIRDIKSILRKSKSNLLSIPEEERREIDVTILILFTAIEYLYQKEKDDKYIFSFKYTLYEEEYFLNNFWGEELLLYIITKNKLNNKSLNKNISSPTYFTNIDNIDYRLEHAPPIEESMEVNDICYINSLYFSATGVKTIERAQIGI